MDVFAYLSIDRGASQPIYRQLVVGLERLCAAHPAGVKLPPERELAERLGCSRTILRQALDTAAAQGLVTRRRTRGNFTAAGRLPKRLLVVHPAASDVTQAWQYVLPGVEARARELGIDLVKVVSSFIRGNTSAETAAFCRRERLSGAILLCGACTVRDHGFALHTDLGTPTLLVMGRDYERVATPFHVVPDCIRPAFVAAILHLRECGHRHVAAIASHFEGGGIRGLSPAEYGALLGHHKPPGTWPCFIWQSPLDADSVGKAVDGMLAVEPRPSAVLCSSDFYAIAVMDALRARHVRVPDDISVMGFCGYPGGAFLDPPLTTVSLRYEAHGRAAVDFFAAGPGASIPEIGFEVIARSSVRAVSSRRGGGSRAAVRGLRAAAE